jgi:hypothetical protein
MVTPLGDRPVVIGGSIDSISSRLIASVNLLSNGFPKVYGVLAMVAEKRACPN